MEDILKEISVNLKGLRAENDMTLEDVSKQVGIHRETIRKYENNPSNMNMEIFVKLLNLYNIDVNIFFDTLYGKMPYKINKKE